VLDFVGNTAPSSGFERLLSSLTGLSRRALTDGVENGFGVCLPGAHPPQRSDREQGACGACVR